MKQIIMILLVLSIPFSLAVDMKITPQITHLDASDSRIVETCVYRANGNPYVGLDLYITSSCRDENHNEACDAAEFGNAAGDFAATVYSSPTNSSGCGLLNITTSTAVVGKYVYSVNSKDGLTIVNSEGALVSVPEFSVVATLVLLGLLGTFIAWRR